MKKPACPLSSDAALGPHLRAVRVHLQHALDSFRQITEQTDDDDWREYASLLGQVADFVEHKSAPLGLRAFLMPEQFRRFALRLRERRAAAHLSRPELAKRAGLSDTTIKTLENGVVSPSRDTVSRLVEVADLKLTWGDVLNAEDEETDGAMLKTLADAELNCYLPPSYDSIRMVQDLKKLLIGPGSHIEQTSAYLEHQSAMAYMTMCNDVKYSAAFRAKMPLDVIARSIIDHSGQVPFKVVALGSGDGKQEVRFVQHLMLECENPDVELWLFDISQPLLNEAYRHAMDMFADQTGIHVYCVHGNFHRLPQYSQVTYASPRSRGRRIYLMLGYTLSNLENEPRFFQYSLAQCNPGDFFVIDLRRTSAPTDSPEAEIRRHDPTLTKPFPRAHAEWLSTLTHLHCRDVSDIDFSWELNTQCPVPGSYSLDAVATVQSNGKPDRRFSMLQVKRYDPEKLTQCIERFGWQRLRLFSFGDANPDALLMLFVKQGE